MLEDKIKKELTQLGERSDQLKKNMDQFTNVSVLCVCVCVCVCVSAWTSVLHRLSCALLF